MDEFWAGGRSGEAEAALRRFLALGAFLALLLLPGGSQAALKPSGIVISPPLQEVKLGVGVKELQVKVSVTNNTGKPQRLRLSSVDFNALDESGGVLFAGPNPTELQQKYGLSRWLRLPSEILLADGETREVASTVVDDGTLSPGGHYGAILFSLPATTGGSDSPRIALEPVGSALIFLGNARGERRALALDPLKLRSRWNGLPGLVTLRFHNSGNVHLTPRGTVRIVSPQGKVVASGVINEDSSITLPETFRRYSVALTHQSSVLVPGRYRVEVAYRYDGEERVTTYVTHVWIWNAPAIFGLLLALGVMVYLLRRLRRR